MLHILKLEQHVASERKNAQQFNQVWKEINNALQHERDHLSFLFFPRSPRSFGGETEEKSNLLIPTVRVCVYICDDGCARLHCTNIQHIY